MKWGVCTTALAPLQQILAFVAWHKHIGAAQIWVHLDDADAVSAQALNQIDGVTAILCDTAYWNHEKGYRPKTQEVRQSCNILRVYRLAALPVIAHVDVDEYLYPRRPMSEVLNDWTNNTPFLRCVPAEALHDPDLTDDIFTARQFRLPFPKGLSHDRRHAVLGDYTPALKDNMLSHKAGKCLFRTGIEDFFPRLHVGTVGKDGPRIDLPFHPDLNVLHFHANDRGAWRAALDHRITKGAYKLKAKLSAYLKEASEAEIDAFYDATQVASPKLVAALRGEGLLVEADLKLKEKVAALL